MGGEMGGGSHLLDFPIALPFPPLGPSVLEPDLGAEVGAEDWGTPPPLPVPAGRAHAGRVPGLCSLPLVLGFGVG